MAFKNNERVPYRLERYVPVGGSLQFEESLYYSDTVKDDHIHYEQPGKPPTWQSLTPLTFVDRHPFSWDTSIQPGKVEKFLRGHGKSVW